MVHSMGTIPKKLISDHFRSFSQIDQIKQKIYKIEGAWRLRPLRKKNYEIIILCVWSSVNEKNDLQIEFNIEVFSEMFSCSSAFFLPLWLSSRVKLIQWKFPFEKCVGI